jgi:two-component system sensor histidine kinase AlgZ
MHALPGRRRPRRRQLSEIEVGHGQIDKQRHCCARPSRALPRQPSGSRAGSRAGAMNTVTVPVETRRAPVPDLASRRALAAVALAMALLAVVFTLLTAGDARDMALRLPAALLALEAVGFSVALVLVALRGRLRRLGARAAWALCCIVVLLAAAAWGWIVWGIDAHYGFPLPIGETRAAFATRGACVGLVVGAALLAYLWQRQRWQGLDELSEADSRYLALQARIRPHFLFNSLNSISSLILTQPEKAEELVTDLADLFRASLDERTLLVPLADEIELVKGYLRIEEARLGDKLLVEWDIPEEVRGALIPRLTIQPLVENAVYHGISRLRAPGLLLVRARRVAEVLVVEVENPLPPDDVPMKKGTGVAVNNIAQRIKLIYGDRASLELGPDRNDQGQLFRARLRVLFKRNNGEGR